MKDKILHIMNDEKVIDRTIDYFDNVYPNNNIYIVLIDNQENEFKYVKKGNKVIGCRYDRIDVVSQYVDQSAHIIIHMLDEHKIKLLENIEHPNITWIAWGSDLYDGLLKHRGYSLYRDKSLPDKIGLLSKKRRNLSLLVKIVDKIRLKRRIRIIKKIRKFAAIEEDYNLLIKYFPELSHLERIDFFYYPIDALVGDGLINKICSGDKIMLGNSSSPNGNHIHALDKISKCNSCQEVIIPLSYGNIRYREWLLKEFVKYRTLDIVPLLNFMPLAKYIGVLLNCGNFIYANLRQEAVGNIIVAFYIGGKVYLDPKNPLFDYFKRLNLVFFSLDDINDNNLGTSLSQLDKMHNQEIIKTDFSFEKLTGLIQTNFPLENANGW